MSGCFRSEEGLYSGLSYLDAYDINLWINDILKKDSCANSILFGISMGGASVATACGLKKIKNVKCLITNSASSSMYKQIKKVYGWMSKFPLFPVFNLIKMMIKILVHFDLENADILTVIVKDAFHSLPTYFLENFILLLKTFYFFRTLCVEPAE